VIGKDLGSRQVIHLINFTGANSLLWRDADGRQLKPGSIDSAGLQLISNKSIRRIWFASPDINNGASREIPFTQTGSQVAFIIPSLLYWDMIVIEYQ
jgi:dextranase